MLKKIAETAEEIERIRGQHARLADLAEMRSTTLTEHQTEFMASRRREQAEKYMKDAQVRIVASETSGFKL